MRPFYREEFYCGYKIVVKLEENSGILWYYHRVYKTTWDGDEDFDIDGYGFESAEACVIAAKREIDRALIPETSTLDEQMMKVIDKYTFKTIINFLGWCDGKWYRLSRRYIDTVDGIDLVNEFQKLIDETRNNSK